MLWAMCEKFEVECSKEVLYTRGSLLLELLHSGFWKGCFRVIVARCSAFPRLLPVYRLDSAHLISHSWVGKAK